MNAVSEPYWMVYASFAVSLFTLAALIWYAWLTRGIEKAANEQSEGLSKPVVTVDLKPVEPGNGTQIGILENAPVLEIAPPEREEYKNFMSLTNIGTGPAINVQWKREEENNAASDKEWHRLAYLLKGQKVPMFTPGRQVHGASWKIVHKYESVSGQRYCSVMTFNNRLAVDFKVIRLRRTAPSKGIDLCSE